MYKKQIYIKINTEIGIKSVKISIQNNRAFLLKCNVAFFILQMYKIQFLFLETPIKNKIKLDAI